MVKVFKSIMAALLFAVMISSCSNGSSGGGDSSDDNSSSSLAGTVWTLSSVKLCFYEDEECSMITGGVVQSGTYNEGTKTIHITSSNGYGYSVSIDYTYEVSGDTMTISAGGESIDFKRQS